MDNVSDIVKATIQAQIIAAFNQGPELIEKLVKAALASPVDPRSGRHEGYGANTPYIDYLIGDEIRNATRNAVREVVKENSSAIEQAVRASLNSETVVASFSKAVIGAIDQDWRLEVNFKAEERR